MIVIHQTRADSSDISIIILRWEILYGRMYGYSGNKTKTSRPHHNNLLVVLYRSSKMSLGQDMSESQRYLIIWTFHLFIKKELITVTCGSSYVNGLIRVSTGPQMSWSHQQHSLELMADNYWKRKLPFNHLQYQGAAERFFF